MTVQAEHASDRRPRRARELGEGLPIVRQWRRCGAGCSGYVALLHVPRRCYVLNTGCLLTERCCSPTQPVLRTLLRRRREELDVPKQGFWPPRRPALAHRLGSGLPRIRSGLPRIPGGDGVKTLRERAEEKRQLKLERVQEMVDDGSLVIRQMTEDERRRYPHRPTLAGRRGAR
jgi:hypothetical protein